MAKSISERIAGSFEENVENEGAVADDRVLQYLQTVRETQIEYYDRMRRSILLLLLVMAIFELLSSKSADQFTLGPLALTNASTIQTYLPTLVAYLYLETDVLAKRADQLSRAYTETFKLWHPPGEANDLDLLVEPSTPLFYAPGTGKLRESHLVSADRVELKIAVVLYGAAIIVPILFEIHAFYVLFHRFHVGSVLVWVNLSASVILIIVTFLHLSSPTEK